MSYPPAMSESLSESDIDAVFDWAAYSGNHANQSDPGQFNAPDQPLVGDDSLPDWSFYTGPQGINLGSGQVSSTHSEGFNSYETGVSIGGAGIHGMPPGFNQFGVSFNLYDGSDFGSTIARANDMALFNVNPSVAGINLGVLFEPPFAGNSAGTRFDFFSPLDATTSSIGQQQTLDELALLQPDSSVHASTNRWGPLFFYTNISVL